MKFSLPKLVVAVGCGLLFLLIFILPAGRENALQSKLERLPDRDFTALAAEARNSGDIVRAVALLDMVETAGLPGADKAGMFRQEWLRSLASEDTALGKLLRIGRIDRSLPGRWRRGGDGELAKWFETLAAESAGEDGLAASTKLFFGDGHPPLESKTVVELAEALRRLAELWGPAPAAAALIEAAVVSGVFTPGFADGLAAALAPLDETLELRHAEVRRAIDHVAPLWELARRSDDWCQFAVFAGVADDPRQLAAINGWLGRGDEFKRRLARLLLVTRAVGVNPDSVLDYIAARPGGEMAVDLVSRKGAGGIDLLLENPGFTPRPVAESTSALDRLAGEWFDLLVGFPIFSQAARFFVLWLLGSVVILIVVPPRKIAHGSGLMAILLFLIFLFSHLSGPGGTELAGGGGLSAATVGQAGGMGGADIVAMAPPAAAQASRDGRGLNAVSLLILMSIIVAQFCLFFRASAEINRALASPGGVDGRIRHLDNMDIFFDLPLYLGLLGTVSAFVIIIFDPSASRLVAYASTIVGIIISASLRTFYLYPCRRRLLEEFGAAATRNGEPSK